MTLQIYLFSVWIVESSSFWGRRETPCTYRSSSLGVGFALAISVAARVNQVSLASSVTRRGLVLPGVTVEASSDVLIEKVRSVVTRRHGQYRIVDLRPGVYTVTVHAPRGFSLFKREGLELSSEFVATVNAELRVGTPGGRNGQCGPARARSSTCRARNGSGRWTTTRAGRCQPPRVCQPDGADSVDGAERRRNPNVQFSPGMIVFGGRGGRGNEGRAQVDGLNTGASLNGGGVSGYRQDVENSQEIAMTTAGGLGETEVGGPAMNIVPRTGGNTFQVALLLHRPQRRHAERQLHQRIIDAGLRTPAKTNYIYDTSYSIGGPIIKDRFWFYVLGVLPRQREQHPRHVPQQERRRHHQVDATWPTRTGRRSAAATARCSRTCG